MRLHVERVHLDRGGYDRHGKYWGKDERQRLYRVSGEEGSLDIDQHVRASDPAEARRKIAIRYGLTTLTHRVPGSSSRDVRRRDTASGRYYYGIWGRAPGYGHESGWAFGQTPELAIKYALADAAKYSRHKWKLPANVYLQPDAGPSLAFYVSADGMITEGQGASRDRSNRHRGKAASRDPRSRGRRPQQEMFRAAETHTHAGIPAQGEMFRGAPPSKASRLARVEAELVYARVEAREWARRDDRLTRDEEIAKRRAHDRVRVLEHEKARLEGRDPARDRRRKRLGLHARRR